VRRAFTARTNSVRSVLQDEGFDRADKDLFCDDAKLQLEAAVFLRKFLGARLAMLAPCSLIVLPLFSSALEDDPLPPELVDRTAGKAAGLVRAAEGWCSLAVPNPSVAHCLAILMHSAGSDLDHHQSVRPIDQRVDSA
jgi:hypothetical protein